MINKDPVIVGKIQKWMEGDKFFAPVLRKLEVYVPSNYRQKEIYDGLARIFEIYAVPHYIPDPESSGEE